MLASHIRRGVTNGNNEAGNAKPELPATTTIATCVTRGDSLVDKIVVNQGPRVRARKGPEPYKTDKLRGEKVWSTSDLKVRDTLDFGLKHVLEIYGGMKPQKRVLSNEKDPKCKRESAKLKKFEAERPNTAIAYCNPPRLMRCKLVLLQKILVNAPGLKRGETLPVEQLNRACRTLVLKDHPTPIIEDRVLGMARIARSTLIFAALIIQIHFIVVAFRRIGVGVIGTFITT